MERRWFVWGFLGEQVDDPWGDSRAPTAGAGAGGGLARPAVLAPRSRRRATASGLARRSPARRHDRAVPDDPPDLAWICFHVLQEYARHAGHLDVAVELAGGELGE